MLLQVGNSWARLLEATSTEEAFVKDFLTLTLTGFKGRPREHSLLTKDRFFPAGLARRVVRAIRNKGFDLQVTERSGGLSITPGTTYCGWTARPHQAAALGALQALGGASGTLGGCRGIIHHGTGTGKGDLIGFLTTRVQGARVLVIVPSKKLQEDLWERFKKFGVFASRWGGGFKEKTGRVVISVVNSLRFLSKQELESFQVVLLDECHGAAGDGLYKVLMACTGASIRLGFSGTPLSRADKKTTYIIGALGEVVHQYLPEAAARDGVVSRAKIRMVPFRHKARPTGGTYAIWVSAAMARNRDRNLLLLRLVSDSPSPRIVFVQTHEHQAVLAELLGTLNCRTVNDQTSAEDVEKILRDFRAGKVPTIVSTPIFRQGIDIAEIRTVIHGGGGKSTVDVIQKVGRGSRRFQKNGSTKDTFHVYDVDDRGCGCGVRGDKDSYQHRSCEWLERHSDERRAAYEKFGYHVFAE